MDDEVWNDEEFLNALVQTVTQFDNPNPNANTNPNLNPERNAWPSIPDFNRNDNGVRYVPKDSSMCFSPPPELSQRHERAELSIDGFGIDNEKSKRDKEIEMLKEEFGRVSKDLSLKERECVELKRDLDKKSEQIRIAFDQIEHKDAEISRLKCIDITHHTGAKDNLAAGPSSISKSKARVENCLASSSEFALQENCSHVIRDENRHSRNMGVQTEFDEYVFDGNRKSNDMECNLSNKLRAKWGIPQSRICGRNLISEVSVTCSADLRVLFKSPGAPWNAKSNMPKYGEAQSPQSADIAKLPQLQSTGAPGNAKSNMPNNGEAQSLQSADTAERPQLHDVLAKVHSGMESPRMLLEALFDLCTLENVEVIHVSLRILNATLNYLSCQTRSNRRKNVLVNHSENNYLGGERFIQKHNISEASSSGYVELDNLFKFNDETLQCDMRLSSETMITAFEKMQQVVLKHAEEQIQTEALSIMNLMLMTCVYADRGKFGLVETVKSLPLLLRKEKSICVREKAVRLLFLILNSPHMLSMFCDWQKNDSELVKQIKYILEGLAESLTARGVTAQVLKLQKNIIILLAFIASLGKTGFDVLLYPATSKNVNFLELIISILASEMNVRKNRSDITNHLHKERCSLMREALILLNRLVSNPVFANVTLGVLTNVATAGLTIDVAKRMSRKSQTYWNTDTSTKLLVEEEITDLAGIFKTRVFTFLKEKNEEL